MSYTETLLFTCHKTDIDAAFIRLHYNEKDEFIGQYFSNIPQFFFSEFLQEHIADMFHTTGVAKELHKVVVTLAMNQLLSLAETRPFWLTTDDFDENGELKSSIVKGVYSWDFTPGTAQDVQSDLELFRNNLTALSLGFGNLYDSEYKIDKATFESSLDEDEVRLKYIQYFCPENSQYIQLPALGETQPHILSVGGVFKLLVHKKVA